MNIPEGAELVFSATNNHVAECGKPTPVFAPKGTAKYVGYFQNRLGEQAVFIYDDPDHAYILMGDVDWQTPIPVRDAMAVGTILGRDESLWLRACWTAATAYDIPRELGGAQKLY